MTTLQRKHLEFETLNRAYVLLREIGASDALLLEMIEHVNNAHCAYSRELRGAQ